MTDWVGRGDLAIFMEIELSTIKAGLADLSLAAAQASVRNYLDQEITLVTDDVAVLDGFGKPWLRLPERPVRSVSLVEEGDGVTADFETVAADDYVLRRSILYRVDGAVWAPGNVNVRVTYTHGWDVATAGTVDSESDSDFEGFHVPADIVLATLSAARRAYLATGEADSGTVESYRIGAYQETRDTDAVKSGGVALISAEKLILDRYRMGAG